MMDAVERMDKTECVPRVGQFVEVHEYRGLVWTTTYRWMRNDLGELALQAYNAPGDEWVDVAYDEDHQAYLDDGLDKLYLVPKGQNMGYVHMLVCVNGVLDRTQDGEVFPTLELAWADIDDFVKSWNEDIPEHNPQGSPMSREDFAVAQLLLDGTLGEVHYAS